MTDIATGFVKGCEAFANTRLGEMSGGVWKDSGSLIGSLTSFDSDQIKARWEQLKADIDAMKPIVEAIAKKIDAQTKLIAKMVSETADDVDSDDFDMDVAARVAIRIGMALAAADEAYNIVATELAKDSAGTVNESTRAGLMELWNPWAMPFKNLSGDSQNLLNTFGREVLGITDLVGDLGKVIELDRSGGQFLLVAKIGKTGTSTVGSGQFLSLDQVSFEAFLQFSDREVANPTEAEKPSLNKRGEKYYRGDVAIIGLRLRSILQPGLTQDKMLAKVMPGAPDPKTQTITAISLDTAQGLYLGDGRGNEKAVLPVRYSFPGVELRELAIGILREQATREVTGFEVTTSIAAKMGDAVGMQVVGSGFIVDLNGVADHHQMFADLPISPRWPDAVGLRIEAGPVVGGGFIQRVEREYTVNGQKVKRVEFGGALQLKVLGFGVTAIVILSPDPFSLVLVIGIRFPVAIDLSFGFTLNGIGGILALDRGLDIEALREGMKKRVLDKMLFPDDPVSSAPTLLDSVAHVFPPVSGGFVIGPIVELGWGSQAKFLKMKLGVVLALPDPKIVVLGALTVQVPHEKAAIVDIKAEVFVAITPDYLLLFASMNGSKIAGFEVSGQLGMYIQWSGAGAFEFSVGGFHPEYTKLTGSTPKLGALDRVQINLSPGGKDSPIQFIVKTYFAITAGSVQLGVEGRLSADFKIIAARAWVIVDVIFIWSPRFAFKASIEVGAEVELLGCTIASVMFRGELEGTRPFTVRGRIRVDVWFLPTFDKNVGPITWGEKPAPEQQQIDALSIVAKALNEPDGWKALLPGHAAELVSLATVKDVEGILAHPLSGLEVSQAHVPLGVQITHIGAAKVKADKVSMGVPTSTAGDAAAISPLLTGFPPGHFFDLKGEKLLSRAGYEDMQGGCRIAMATTPKVAATATDEVRYHTYVRDENERLIPRLVDWGFERYAGHVNTSVVGRAQQAAVNPYLPPRPQPEIAVDPLGTSILVDAATGMQVLAGLGALSATQADVIGAALHAEGVADVARVTVRS